MRCAAAVALCCVLSASASAQDVAAVRRAAPDVLDVPFVSQDELLCGGAAAAMLLRAAGARGVQARDFRSLVDRSAGGIRTDALVAALASRGHRVRAIDRAELAGARALVAKGQPVAVLIEDRPGRYHYVVMVGWTQGAVVYHDPARAPFVRRDETEFDRAWSRAGRWMLVVEEIASTERVERSTDEGPPSPALREFMERDYRQAARLARETLRVHPLDTDSWRLLGASRYLTADLAGALDAWNRAGTPTVDLITIEGLSHTPHRVVEQVLGIEPGDLLTRTSLTRAARRASLLPAQQMARVTYRAVPGNLAEVRGAIIERTRIPSRADWLVEAVRLPLDRELEFSIGNAATAGDRLTVGWRFWEHRPRGSIAFSFPNVRGAGIWTIAASWQQERYASAPRSEAREARIGWTNWVAARLRLEGGAGVLRQEGRATQAVLDWSLEYRPLDDNVAVGVEARAAPGALSFATGSATARWRGRAGGTALTAGVSVSKTSALAPIDRWPGAGTGRARPLLLRAHPLLDDGIVGGDVFGRAVLQSSVEAERPVLSRGFLRSALAVFADAARAWQRVDGSNSPLHVDVGVGLRLRMAGMPAVRVDVARGLADGRTVLSAGWQIDWRTPPRSTAR